MGDELAAAVFSYPPYNVKIDGHVSGRGKHHHREFAMAAGEMDEAQFTEFLKVALVDLAGRCADGAVLFICMDWRHLFEIITAARAARCSLINFCVCVKPRAGLGSFYRSQHELVLVLKAGRAPHRNNVELGRHGRNRSNVWSYPGGDIVLDAFLGSGSTLIAAEKTGRRCFALELDTALRRRRDPPLASPERQSRRLRGDRRDLRPAPSPSRECRRRCR